MPPRLTYPGVYVEERSSGVQAIAGVSTATTLFIGMARRGQLNRPTAVRSFDQFEQLFGGDFSYGEMAAQVRQFFLNGGAEAVVVRIAKDADTSAVTLRNEAGADVLRLEARDAGLVGDQIRVEVDYDTPTPELTFNLQLYRQVVRDNGVATLEDTERFSDLSMDRGHPRYVRIALDDSALVKAVDAEGLEEWNDDLRGFSQAAQVFRTADDVREAAGGEIALGTADALSIAVDGGRIVVARLPVADPADFNDWAAAINAALVSDGQQGQVEITTVAFGGGRSLRITSSNGGSVSVQRAARGDVAPRLGLGAAAGGLELGAASGLRPAPTGFVTRIGGLTGLGPLSNFASATRNQIASWSFTGTMPTPIDADQPVSFEDQGESEGEAGTFLDGEVEGRSLRNSAAHLSTLAAAMDRALGQQWSVRRVGYRIALTPNFGYASAGLNAALTTSAPSNGLDIGASGQIATTAEVQNIPAYGLGGTPENGKQGATARGDDGSAPDVDAYVDAFAQSRREHFFALVTAPRADGQDDAARVALWGPLSARCRDARAFLIVDPPSGWSSVDQARDGIEALRLGVVTDHAAIYWPKVRVGFRDGFIDPAGTVAGVMASTDTRRGVSKAPAGLGAKTLGVTGFEHVVTDAENGVTNPQAINTLRQFPAGGVVWGARTMAGFENSGEFDYAYVPVRRTALFIEESLYRGLRFAVFEPNDFRLWGQIRLAAGGFMQNLFRQGAFQGSKASDAYQVVCDETTTTPHDVALGRVNVLVRFAPLRPAEFVVLIVQQLAGQVQS